MRRYFTSLMIAVGIVVMVLIAWTPVAKCGQPAPVFLDCLDFCEDQAICECAKILGGSLRLTKCNIGASCEYTGNENECVCDVDPLCKLWEKDVVSQSFPVLFPNAQNCFSD